MESILYKLYSDIDNRFYVGATTLDMNLRFDKYRCRPPNKRVALWFDEIGIDNIKIEILNKFKDITEYKLVIIEDELIEYQRKDKNCLNRV